MKKILCMILCLVMLTAFFGCNQQPSVPAPMEYPDYTFDDTPNTMEMRLTAVKAMKDLLSVPWCTDHVITYKKNGPVSGKQFLHEPGYTYAGVLYSSASSGLFQFFEYYDANTGLLTYEGTADELKLDLGSSCADALLWAWSTVCNSVKGGFYPVMMVPANGYIPVGNYTIKDTITSFNEYPSYAIIDSVPKEVMLDAYAQCLPADAIISTSKNHAMMAIEPAVVVKNADGSINPDESYIMIQDQRGGSSNTSFYEVEENGHTLYFSGRTSAKFTFAKLYEDDYIPITAPEFVGTKPYDKASVSATEGVDSIDKLAKAQVESNYPLAVINLIVTGKNGKQTIVDRLLFNGSSADGVPKTCYLSTVYGISDLPGSSHDVAGNTITIEVVVSTGERFTPISFELK